MHSVDWKHRAINVYSQYVCKLQMSRDSVIKIWCVNPDDSIDTYRLEFGGCIKVLLENPNAPVILSDKGYI